MPFFLDEHFSVSFSKDFNLDLAFQKNGEELYRLECITNCLPGFLHQDCKIPIHFLRFTERFNMIDIKSQMKRLCNDRIANENKSFENYYEIGKRNPNIPENDPTFKAVFKTSMRRKKDILEIILGDMKCFQEDCEYLGLSMRNTDFITTFILQLENILQHM